MGVSLHRSHPLARLFARPARESPPAEELPGLRSFLYDADGSDGLVALDELDVDRLGEAQLLWVDVADLSDLPFLADTFALADETVDAVLQPSLEPSVVVFEGYVQVAVVLPGETAEAAPQVLQAIVGDNWVVTAHRGPLELLTRFEERIRVDGALGRIDSHAFLAAILQEHVAHYLAALRPIEADLDLLDLRSMTGRMDEEALLRELVGARIRLTRLRRLLEPHREVFARLTRSEFAVLSGSASVAEFEAVAELLERALTSMDATREMIAGSFEIYTTWAAHRTNKLIKQLTIASVTILPPTLLAGIMGMNSLPPSFSGSAAFWLTVAAMAGVAAAVVTAAARRGWF